MTEVREGSYKGFTVGDTVILTENSGTHCQKGAEAIVKGFNFDEDMGYEYLVVEWIRDERCENQNDGGYGFDTFKVKTITDWKNHMEDL